MAEYNKQRYYWIKLTDRFMTSDTVDFLMGQKDGANYVVLYQMLCLKSINQNGELASRIGEVIIPFDEEKIQRDCKWFSIDTIRVALSLYNKLGLIYMQDNGILKIAEFDRLIGSQTISAEKKQLQLLGKGGKKVENFPPEKDIRERDKDIQQDIKEEKKDSIERKTASRFTQPTLEEVKTYCAERENGVDAQRFYDYYTANGWKVGRNTMKDWKAAVRTWERTENNKQVKTTHLSDEDCWWDRKR